MTESAKLEFGVDLQISVGPDQFSMTGDQNNLVLHFPSVRCAVRVCYTLVRGPFKQLLDLTNGLGNTLIEARIRGLEVARYRYQSDADIVAKFFGLAGTEFRMRNFIMSMTSLSRSPVTVSKTHPEK